MSGSNQPLWNLPALPDEAELVYPQNNVDITLGTLATGSTAVSGIFTNNATTPNSSSFSDLIISGSFTTASSGVSGSGSIVVKVEYSIDGINFSGPVTLQTISATEDSTTYGMAPTSVAEEIALGYLPPFLKFTVTNNTGANLVAGYAATEASGEWNGSPEVSLYYAGYNLLQR